MKVSFSVVQNLTLYPAGSFFIIHVRTSQTTSLPPKKHQYSVINILCLEQNPCHCERLICNDFYTKFNIEHYRCP